MFVLLKRKAKQLWREGGGERDLLTRLLYFYLSLRAGEVTESASLCI